MIFISITRLRVSSFWYLFRFFKASEASVKQLIKTPGFLGGKELIDKHFTFWILTLWNNAESMKEFRNGAAHRKAMQKLPVWCDEAAYAHWFQENETAPAWNEAYQKLLNEGKLTKVRHPSKEQAGMNYPPPKWTKLERVF